MFAPAQLPLAPRPLPNELLSSWLLRTAAANAIPFAELVEGIRRHHPETFLPGQAVDYAVPETTLQALSQWTRVPYAKLRALDLRVRLPQMNTALLLRFPPVPPFGCPQGRSWRVRYAFCPSCVRQQKLSMFAGIGVLRPSCGAPLINAYCWMAAPSAATWNQSVSPFRARGPACCAVPAAKIWRRFLPASAPLGRTMTSWA